MLLNCGVREDSWESLGEQGDQISQSQRKSVLNIHWKDLCWSYNTLATWCKEPTHWKRLRMGKIEGRRGQKRAEDEMVGWHHRLNGHESEQTPGGGVGQGSLACCSPWGHKQSDTTWQLNNNNNNNNILLDKFLPLYRQLLLTFSLEAEMRSLDPKFFLSFPFNVHEIIVHSFTLFWRTSSVIYLLPSQLH